MSWGASLQWVDNTQQTRTEAGTLRSEGVSAFRRFTFNLDWLTDADQVRLASETRKVGKKKDILIAGYPADDGAKGVMFTMVAKLVDTPAFTAAQVNTYQTALTFEEA